MKNQIMLITFTLFFSVSGSTAQEDWFHQSPPPTSARLNDLHVFDINNAIAVGFKGTVMKTMDGGENWTIKPSKTLSDLYAVHFVNASTGWAVGSSGTIIKTNDGGESWEKLTSGTTQKLYSVQFVDADIGWAVGSNRTILKTTDGGANWISQFSTATKAFLEDVYFMNSNTGVAVGWSGDGNVYRTTDGGQNWTGIDLGNAWIKKVHFLNDMEGWAVGITASVISVTEDVWGNIYTTVNGEHSAIWKTTDGGATWDKTTLASTDWLYGVYFSSTDLGWAVGGEGTILNTTNGGTTWNQQTSVTGLTNSLFSVKFLDTSTGWIVGNDGAILKTTNGGIAWDLESGSGTTNALNSIFFLNHTTGWAAGIGGIILNTTDGGTNWLTQQTPSGLTRTLQSIRFIDESNGWAVGYSGTILNTNNGGTSWNKQPSMTTKRLQSVCFIDAFTGWTVGDAGTILNTTDGGASWNEQTSGTDNTLNSVCFVNASTGWAVGNSGMILNTTNGGTNWNEQSSETSRSLLSVYFIDNMTGWAVGYSGTILNTINGGTSWTAQSSGITNSLSSVYFVNDLTGWVVGSGGKIQKTTDGGNSWGEQNSGTFNSLYGVYFVDATTGWVAGNNGIILKTITGGGVVLPVPTLASPTNRSTQISTTPTLSWNPTSGALSYNLQVSKASDFSSSDMVVEQSGITGTSFTLPDLDFNTRYFWRLNAEYAEGTSTWSSVWNFTTVAASVPTLAVPSNGATGISTNPNLSWNPVEGAISYQLQVSRYSSFLTPIVDVSGLTDTSYSVSGLDGDRKYYWRVNAEYAGGTSGWSSVWNFTTVAAFVPTLAVPSNGATGISTNPNLSWNPVEGAISYQLQVSRYSSFLPPIVDVSGLTDTSYSVSGLDGDRKYYWRVNAEYAGGTSGWSNIWSFTTAPDAPESPRLSSPRDGELQPISPVLDWSTSYRADTYRLQLSTDITFNILVYDDSTITDTEKQVGPLNYLTTYFWRVNSKNAGGTSTYSEIRSFKTGAEEWHAQQSGTLYGLYSVHFIDADTGWVVSRGGAILKTTDGGTSWDWNELTSDLEAIYFIDALTGWGVGRNGTIFKTTNGGTIWNGLSSGTTEDLEAVYFIDSQTGWAAGYNKTILKTTDGGTSWITQSSGTYPFLNDIYFINSQIGWAVGGEILKTTDGGATWSTIWDDAVSTAVHFIDEQLGWVVGWDGAIYKTSDGGISWDGQTSGVTEDLEDVFFVDSLNGCAVGRDGIILKTIDGGNHWKLLESGTNEDLHSVHFVNENTGWVVGSRGIILKTTTGGGITAIEEIKNKSLEIPEHFILYQNYPNPFNPTTIIEYQLPESEFVTIKVYDILGEEIAKLVNDEKRAGKHRVTLDGTGLASGIYYYKISAGDFVETRKMMLMK